MRPSLYLVSLFVSFCYLHSAAQQGKTGTWELSATATHFTFSGTGQHTGYGIMADYYLTDHISVRGGLVGNSNYIKFSPAPFLWSALANGSALSPHTTSSRRNGGGVLVAYLMGLTMSDGFAYNIRVNKDLYIAPYIAPLQMQFYGPNGHAGNNLVLVSSLGVGVKGYFHKHYMYYAGAEYSKSFLFYNGAYGYSMNASIGYVFR